MKQEKEAKIFSMGCKAVSVMSKVSNLAKSEIALHNGVNQSTVWRWLSGESVPAPRDQEMLRQYFLLHQNDFDEVIVVLKGLLKALRNEKEC